MLSKFGAVAARFDWARAFYLRVPESIAAGVVAGGIAGAGTALLASGGQPTLMLLTLALVAGIPAGAILGSLVSAAAIAIDYWRETRLEQ